MAEGLATTGADFELNPFCCSKSRAALHSHTQSSSYGDKVRFHFEDAKTKTLQDYQVLNLRIIFTFVPLTAHQGELSETFNVKIASTGDVLGEAGIEIAMSCEQGGCGSCLARVLEGTPGHRDFFMTDYEYRQNDQFTPYCSRSKTPVLDM